MILDSPHWMSVILPNGTTDRRLVGGRLRSLLRDLIENMPEEAAHVLGKCISGCDHAPTDSDDFEVTDRVDKTMKIPSTSFFLYRFTLTIYFFTTRMMPLNIIREGMQKSLIRR